MNADFFHAKRPWSKYKDSILRYYLEPYIPKVARLRKPILIVDCFAGRGKFDDGEPGSPLIICEAIKNWRGKGIKISGEFIESDSANFAHLERVLEPYRDFATTQCGSFENRITEFASRAKTESIFLYIDPYTVKGLIFSRLQSIYDQIQKARASVEVLMNFNVATFMRWALAAQKRADALPIDATDDEADYQADDPSERVEIATLNDIAGGDYWQTIVNDTSLQFNDKLISLTDQYAQRMLTSFSYVCSYPVKSKYEHQTPKYMLIYATRHLQGLAVMNDAMCDARQTFLGSRFQKGLLFDMTPPGELSDIAELKSTLTQIIEKSRLIDRKNARLQVVPLLFCRHTQTEINRAISELLKEGKIFTSTGKVKINDRVTLSTRPFK